MSCEQCIKESRINLNLSRLLLQNPKEHNIVPEDTMQIDLVLELPPSGGYEKILTAKDVFPAIYLPTRHLIITKL